MKDHISLSYLEIIEELLLVFKKRRKYGLNLKFIKFDVRIYTVRIQTKSTDQHPQMLVKALSVKKQHTNS